MKYLGNGQGANFHKNLYSGQLTFRRKKTNHPEKSNEGSRSMKFTHNVNNGQNYR